MASSQQPMTSAAERARKEFLAKLKPVCVAMSRLSMGRDQPSSTGVSQLIIHTSSLYTVLDEQVKLDEHVITANDAEYVFVPLSYVFQRRDAYPALLLENAVRCLRLLVRHGWRTAISAELARQLLILLTFLIGGVPGGSRAGKDGKKKQAPTARLPEETILESFRTMTTLFEVTGRIHASASPFVDAAAVPTMLQSVSVVLDGVTGGTTPDIQLEALETLRQIYSTVHDREALASFLPGTVSSLTKILSPPQAAKSQRRVLIKGLFVLKRVLVICIGDMKVRSLLAQIEMEEKKGNERGGIEPVNDDNATAKAPAGKELTPAWLKATTGQIKTFLASVLKLRNHDAGDVLEAVGNFCATLLDECHRSLSDCASMLVESALIAGDPDAGSYNEMANNPLQDPLNYESNLQTLAMVFPELGDIIKLTVYDWVASLPRDMQAGDEDAKRRSISRLVKGSKMLKNLGLDSTTIQDSIARSLRDSVVALTIGAKPPKLIDESGIEDSLSSNTALVKPDQQTQGYQPVMLAQESQKKTREELVTFISGLGTPSQQVKLAAEMLSYVQDSEGVDQISSYWLSFQLIKAAYANNKEEDAFLDLSSVTAPAEDLDSIFGELYAFSVSTLVLHSDAADAGTDWRLEAIALEIATFAASLEREAFRPELIDVLYPIATFLGSPHAQLRSHAVVTLNSIATFCGYGSVSELIIGNVDYMVNSVSLRLNTFDISPASTKVLTMMIHLTGPKLLPYLDDVVAAIFAALDNYHGYPVFVESLFSVLSEVVAQGVKSDALLIGDGTSDQVSHRKHAPKPTTTDDILTMLETHAEKRKRTEEEEDVEEISRGHPKRPWKSEAKHLMDKLDAQRRPKDEDSQEEDDDGGDEEGAADGVDKIDIPKTPTYALLARITTLTQHYLTSPAPTLRKSLLDLLATVAPALAPDEDAFLPLVNAIWPVLITRLYDSEPYVSIAAAEALGALCAGAGDFLASRFKTEWGDGLERWCVRAKTAAAAGAKGASGGRRSAAAGPSRSPYLGASSGDSIVIPIRSIDGDVSALQLSSSSPSGTVGALGRHAQTARVWEATGDLLAQVVSHVRVDEVMFDAILELLVDDRDGGFVKPEYREALEAVNADAVWLALYRRGKVEWMPTPEVKEAVFVDMSVRVEGHHSCDSMSL